MIIESIRLLEKDEEQFVHVRSKDGAEGLSLTNRRRYFAPILKEMIIPFFIGKDARKLESELLFDLYRYRSNYKLQGLAFWSAQAWVEFAILDMLGARRGQVNGRGYSEAWSAVRSRTTSPAADGIRPLRRKLRICRSC